MGQLSLRQRVYESGSGLNDSWTDLKAASWFPVSRGKKKINMREAKKTGERSLGALYKQRPRTRATVMVETMNWR